MPQWRIPFTCLDDNASLGQGTAGIIYAISDDIVIKVPVQYHVDTADEHGFFRHLSLRSLKALENEASIYDILASKPHKNILRRIHGSPKKCLFLERVATTLESQFMHPSPVGINARQRWIMQLVSAAEWLEQIGLSHGDLRVNNVLVDVNGVLKLCDFDQTTTTNHQRLRDDLRNLGTCIHFILHGTMPHPELREPEQNHKLEDGDFPATDNVFGPITHKCWQGGYKSIALLQRDIRALLVDLQEPDATLLIEHYSLSRLKMECISWLQNAGLNREWEDEKLEICPAL
ncbi:MAG: hypothetical protein M1837_000343 [Sclerophora amabilis]|nr:MAG: hypothetical protein M1837_000343 [Sclerophora amabilis]